MNHRFNQWFWVQLVLFQSLWLISVIGQNDWLLIAATLLGLHLFFTPGLKQDLRIIPLALIGIAIDAALTFIGVFSFSTFPYWLIFLWLGFVLSLGHSLEWLKKIPVSVLIPLGAIMGSASYLSGWKLDAVYLPMGVASTAIVLALVWSFLLPLMLKLDTSIRSIR